MKKCPKSSKSLGGGVRPFWKKSIIKLYFFNGMLPNAIIILAASLKKLYKNKTSNLWNSRNSQFSTKKNPLKLLGISSQGVGQGFYSPTCPVSCFTCHLSHVTCHMSRVLCPMVQFVCQLSPVTNAPVTPHFAQQA